MVMITLPTVVRFKGVSARLPIPATASSRTNLQGRNARDDDCGIENDGVDESVILQLVAAHSAYTRQACTLLSLRGGIIRSRLFRVSRCLHSGKTVDMLPLTLLQQGFRNDADPVYRHDP